MPIIYRLYRNNKYIKDVVRKVDTTAEQLSMLQNFVVNQNILDKIDYQKMNQYTIEDLFVFNMLHMTFNISDSVSIKSFALNSLNFFFFRELIEIKMFNAIKAILYLNMFDKRNELEENNNFFKQFVQFMKLHDALGHYNEIYFDITFFINRAKVSSTNHYSNLKVISFNFDKLYQIFGVSLVVKSTIIINQPDKYVLDFIRSFINLPSTDLSKLQYNSIYQNSDKIR
jgi:hypothetical protein